MGNILQFKKKTPLSKYYYKPEVTQLEDGSIWWRFKCLNDGKYSEWRKLDEQQ